MLKNTRSEELKFFYELANIERPNTPADLPITYFNTIFCT